MSCCDTTKQGFLLEKATNFKKYLESFSPDEELQAYIDGFKPESLNTTIMTVVLPIVSSGETKKAVVELMNHLTVPEKDKANVFNKFVAYLEMFYKVALS